MHKIVGREQTAIRSIVAIMQPPNASIEGQMLSAFCFLLSAFCFLLSAFCFLLSAFCFLLSAFCFLPTAYCIPSRQSPMPRAAPHSAFRRTALSRAPEPPGGALSLRRARNRERKTRGLYPAPASGLKLFAGYPLPLRPNR